MTAPAICPYCCGLDHEVFVATDEATGELVTASRAVSHIACVEAVHYEARFWCWLWHETHMGDVDEVWMAHARNHFAAMMTEEEP